MQNDFAELAAEREIEIEMPSDGPGSSAAQPIGVEIMTAGYHVLFRDTIGQLPAGKYRMLVLFLPRE